MKKLCYNCMKPLSDNGGCEYCRSTDQTARAPYHIEPGTKISGRYIVGRSLGEGGFGITYIGFDERLNRRIAIKECYPSGVANRVNDGSSRIIITRGKENFFDRTKQNFMDEARSVAQFTNEEGIVDIYDYFEENGTAYIIMEYLEGITLKQHLKRRGPMPETKLISLLTPVMKSLYNMHNSKIIHRDISPDNIMYTTSGKLKLMDFGAARFFANEDKELSVILKHGYAPEEQYRSNGKQGPYTDVYSLCATIYYCITGKPPVDSIVRLSSDTLVPPSQLGVNILPAHEAALMHGLAVRAENRCRDMKMLIDEMQGDAPPGYYNDATRTVSANTYGQNVIPNNGQGYYGSGYMGQNSVQQGNYYDQPPKKQNNTPIIIAIAASAVAIAALVAVICIMLMNNQSDPDDNTGNSNAATQAAATHDSNSYEDDTTEKATEAVTAPPAEESDDDDSPESSYTSKYPDLGLSKDEVNNITSNIIAPQYDATMENNADRTSGNYTDASRYKRHGDYSIFNASDGSYRIITPYDRWGDGQSDRSWYYYDKNGTVCFIIKIKDLHQYRYYIYKDQIIKYTYAEYEGASQDKYYYGDSILTDSLNDEIVGEAKSAQSYVLNN